MPRYYIVEDEHAVPHRDTTPTLFRYSVVRAEDEQVVFRAGTYDDAEKLVKRLQAFTEVKAR